MATENEKPWVRVFLTCAERAIRRVHLDYELAALRAPGDELIRKLGGIGHAHETSVVAAMVQEFASSKLAWAWRKGADGEDCRFLIRPEEPYGGGTRERSDLALIKVGANGDWIGGDQYPGLIEAKRSRRDRFGKLLPVDHDSLAEDVIALRKRVRRKKGLGDFQKARVGFGRVLVWGEVEAKEVDRPWFNTISAVRRVLKERGSKGPDFERLGVRAVPLRWKFTWNSKVPDLSHWLWVGLWEVARLSNLPSVGNPEPKEQPRAPKRAKKTTRR